MGICLSDMEQLGFKLVMIKVDYTELNSKFTKGSVWPYEFEHENNYIIKIDGTYYGPLKECCERVSL